MRGAGHRGGAPAGGRRLVALDGLRGVAVAGVLIYHLGVTWLPGGLLGLDMFFVLSGFLITRLLLAEHRRSGRIDLPAFWVRRVRRLLPALLVMLAVVVGTLPWTAAPGADIGSVRADGLAALAYVANWRFAFSHQSYFEHFSAPSPLLHLWSLGVEEQFYLLWPPVALAALGVHRARRRRRVGGPRYERLAAVAVGGVVASATLMATLAVAGVDTSRLYYGTDTRAVALLVGAALACWRPLREGSGEDSGGRSHRRAGPPGWLPVAGAAGALVLAVMWFRVPGQDPVLYRGGFLLVALAVAALIATAVLLPTGVVARVLSVRPLAGLGKISYSVYLWHWPVFGWFTHDRTGLSGTSLLVARLLLALAVGMLSFALVEEPFRRRRVRLPRPRMTVPALVAAVAVVVAAVQPASGGGSTDVASGLAAAQQAANRERTQVTARPAAPGDVKVLLAGDSVALTLGFALIPQLPPQHVRLLDDGIVGCSLAPGKGLPQGYGPDAFEPEDCATTQVTRWRNDLAYFRPDVTALLVGRWETVDRRLPDGQVVHVGQPANDRLLRANLEYAVAVLTSTDAKLALITAPCFQGPERPDGGHYPQDDPARVNAFNSLLRSVAQRHPGRVTLIDLHGLLCPGGRYQPSIGGVPVRMADGTHIATTAGPLVAGSLLPLLRQLARSPG